MPQNTEKLPKTANFLSKKLSVYNTHENRYLRGPQFNIDIMLNNILCIVYISTCFAKIGISRFLVSIEEKDYRDVSKVVLPLLYPSMFTVTQIVHVYSSLSLFPLFRGVQILCPVSSYTMPQHIP